MVHTPGILLCSYFEDVGLLLNMKTWLNQAHKLHNENYMQSCSVMEANPLKSLLVEDTWTLQMIHDDSSKWYDESWGDSERTQRLKTKKVSVENQLGYKLKGSSSIVYCTKKLLWKHAAAYWNVVFWERKVCFQTFSSNMATLPSIRHCPSCSSLTQAVVQKVLSSLWPHQMLWLLT